MIENLAHLADGAAYPAIRPYIVAGVEAVFPTPNFMRSFDSCVYPWIECMGKNEKQIEILLQLRDTLLPKLLSGEIRIPDAKKLIAEAGL